ncbi:hypothetical protein DFP82_11246 [Psychrobacter fozii]|uniref:Uncharacterized protein n=1 Tax=Psychrobacter fozii TaxID=198480 RepID=A0A2V4UUY9_9GAMM|nr:hypothetical protein DFP82_11246 [Psychrobacter fozii]
MSLPTFQEMWSKYSFSDEKYSASQAGEVN